MARDPYTGIPDVSAAVDQPNDQIRVDASPASFGAGLAQGAEALGQGVIDYSKFYSQVAADQATNNYLDARTKILYGDPGKPMTDAGGEPVIGPDGKPLPDTGYFGRKGADAMAARAQTQAALDEAATEQQEGLTTPAARLAFENQSRRYRSSDLADMGRHADQQQSVWAADTNKTAMTLALNDVGRFAADDTASAAAGERAISGAVKNAQLAGEDPAGAVLKARQEIALTRIRALSTPQAGVGGATKAEDVFNKNSDILASLPNYDQIGRQVKEGVFNAVEAPAVDSFVARTMADAQAAVGAHPGGTGGPSANSIGNVKIGGAFAQPASPVDGVILAASNLRKDYRGLTIGQIAEKWAPKGDGANDPAAWARNVSAASGIATNAVPNLDDPAVLASLVHGVGVAEKSRGQLAAFTPEVIRQGVTGALAGRQAALGPSGGSGGQYPSVADAINARMPQYLEQAQAEAERLFPNYLDRQAAHVQTVERRLNQVVEQQRRQYEVDSHIVQGAMAGDNPPISEEDLKSRSPEIARAWASMQVNNSLAAMGIERMFDVNAKGKAGDFGGAFHDYLDRALSPQTDPNRIANPAQLWPFVGAGPEAPLTNTGVGALSNVLGIRGTPQGEAQAAQIKAFVDQVHGNLTFSNKGTGVIDEKGEKIFTKFMAGALPVLVTAARNNNLASVLDPKSKDYLGTTAATFARPPAQILADRAKYDHIDINDPTKSVSHPLIRGPAFTMDTLRAQLNSLENDRQRTEFWTDAVRAGRISPQLSAAYRQAAAGPKLPTGAPVPTVHPHGNGG